MDSNVHGFMGHEIVSWMFFLLPATRLGKAVCMDEPRGEVTIDDISPIAITVQYCFVHGTAC